MTDKKQGGSLPQEATVPNGTDSGAFGAVKPSQTVWKAGRAAPPARRARPAPLPAPASAGAVAAAAQPIVYRGNRGERHPLLHGIGNLFYTLGFGAEIILMRIWRVMRDGGIFFGQMAAWIAGRLAGGFTGLLRRVWRDITAPWRRFRRRRRQLRRVHERMQKRAASGAATPRKALVGVRVKSGMQLAGTLLGYIMPVVATAILVVTVSGIMNMNYVLEVSLEGQRLGYVTDQSVVEGAKGLLRDRIRLAKNQELSDWQLNPTYSLAYSAKVTTTQELVDQILFTSTDSATDLKRATGVTINGELFGVTTEGEALQDFLDGMLDEAQAEAPSGAEVSFVKQVECDPPNEYAYFASSVEDYDDLIGRLTRDVSDDRVVLADGASTLAELAYQNNITLELLMQRNPEFADQPDDYVPEAGRSILVRRAQPFLQVQTSVKEYSVEEIPYQVEEVETDSAALGVRNVVQEGIPGQQEVWDQVYYIDGEEDRRERLEEETVVIQEPVDEIIEVGTYDFSDVPTGEFGAYYFPVPASTWSSRGVGGHRGMDINAPTGTPIFAANEGTVEVAGWHWSYGWYIILKHQDGLTTLYGHCSSLAVEAGQHVMRGQYIGAVGSTGVSTGPHLHLEFYYVSNQPLDPLNYVSPPEGYIMRWRRQ